MSQVTLRIHNKDINIESSAIHHTSASSIKIYENHVPAGVVFPEADCDSPIAGLTLAQSIDKLAVMGPHLKAWQKAAATIIAIAGVALIGFAVYAALTANLPLAAGAFVIGLPTLGIGYSIINKENHRWPIRHAVQDLFSDTMDYYTKNAHVIKSALETTVNELEQSLDVLKARDIHQWRKEDTMAVNQEKRKALVELTDNETYFREKRALLKA